MSFSLYVGIDQSTGTFDVVISYEIAIYMDPLTLEWIDDTTWSVSYSRLGGPLLGHWNGEADSPATLTFADLAVETGPGLKTYVIDISASNIMGQGQAASWNVFSVAYDTTPQIVAGTIADDVIIGGGASDELRGFDGSDFIGAGDGNDFVEAGAGDDVLDGYVGDDILIGGTGGDHLYGGVGDDILIGGTGDDWVTVDSAGDILIEYAGEGYDRVFASTNFTLTDNFEELNFGGLSGLANLNGTGNASGNAISGNSGANTLSGLDGNDSLHGYSGDDVLRGGAGADILSGSYGNDTASYYNGATGVVVSVIVVNDVPSVGSGGEAEGDRLVDIENVSGSQGADSLIGDSGANTLQGWYGNDTLTGNGGNDLLNGGGGNDVLYGYLGADSLDGGTGSDTASYYTGTTGIVVDLVSGTGSGGQAAGDMLTGIENLSGSHGDDSLIGNSGMNTLQGWNGNDVLTGAGGKDALAGGTGTDRFAYTASADSAVGANADRITDFSHAQGDKIDLSAIDADTGTAGDQAFSFIGTAVYTGVAGQLRYHSNGTITTIAGDINGDGTSDFHIQLTGSIGVMAGDFVM